MARNQISLIRWFLGVCLMTAIAGIGFLVGKRVVGSNPLVTGSALDWLEFTGVALVVSAPLYFLIVPPVDRWMARLEHRSRTRL